MANATDALHELEEVLSLSAGLLATKYLEAASLTCVLYDWLLLFQKELKLIWHRQFWSLPGIAYIMVRYSNLGLLLYSAYVMAGFWSELDDNQCRTFLMANGFTGLLCMGFANAFLGLRIFALWDNRKNVKIIIFTLFAITYSTVLALWVRTLMLIYRTAYYNELLSTCLLSERPDTLVGVWITMSAFDVSVIILGVVNALHQPYTQNVEVITRFRRDGAIFFLSVFALRIINLVCSIVLRTEYLLVNLFVVWGMVSITTCRLILRVEEIKLRANRHVRFRTYEMGEWRPYQTNSM